MTNFYKVIDNALQVDSKIISSLKVNNRTEMGDFYKLNIANVGVSVLGGNDMNAYLAEF